MKRLFLIASNILFCILTATAQEPCLVSFDLNYNATEKISPISVNTGNAMPMAAKPLPERTGYRFGGWYTTPDCRPEQEWRFGSNSVGFYMPATDSMTVKAPMTLYAKWVAPTPVRTVKDLDAIREDLYGWYVLENDIDLSEVANWIPIGEYEGNYEFAPGEWWRHAFKGILDGKGHTIRGLRITELTTDKSALFGTVANGVIRNLRMEDSRLEFTADKPYVAPLAGILKQDDGLECIVQNCEIANTLIKVRTTNAENTFHSFTGLCGGAWGGTIENCSVSGKMQLEMAGKGGGELYVGSFLGEAYNDTRNCSSHFDIDIQFVTPAEGEYKAFIGGLQSSATNVSNCSASGTIRVKGNPGSETIYLGGLIGSERYGTVENCASSVKITALDMPAVQIGGIVGEFNSGYGTIGAAFGIKVTTVRNCSYAGSPVIEGVGKPVFGEISGAGQPAPLSSPWGLSMDYKLENNAYQKSAPKGDDVSCIGRGTQVPAASNFLNPDLKYAPLVRWWWPGNDVEDTELKRELELFASKHIGGVEIQSFALVVPMPEGRAGAIMSFDTDSYFEHLSTVMSTAARLGMTVDLTNGSGWPAASPAITEAEENRSLQYGMAAVPETGGTIAIPRSERQDSEYATLIGLLEAQVAENENGPRQIKDVKVLPLADKAVTFARAKVEKGWQRSLIALWSVPSQEINMITARPDGGKVIDHFDSIVVQKTYEHYFGARSGLTPFYGKPFRSIFNNSYEFKVDRHITADFRDVFQRNRGYDPLPWMPANICYGYNNMYDAGKGYAEFTFGDVDARLRYDYDLTVSDLVRTHLLRGSSHWAKKRGLLHKTQPYGLPMDYMGAAGDADIPETENMVFGGGSVGGLKMVSSGAMLYGKTLVTAESGVHLGRGLMMTPQKLKMTVDKNLSSGVNQLIWHGAPYRYGEDGSWQPFFNGLLGINFSSDLSEANHFWDEVAEVNQYAQRAQYLMQQGKAVADVLVYYPFLDYSDRSHNPEELLWYGFLPETEPAMQLNDEIPDDSENGCWLQGIWPVLNELERKGITWAWVNDESLQEMTAGDDGSLQIRGNAYKGLVLFELPYIQLATAQNLAVQNSANILLIGEAPVAQPSFLDYQKNDRETARLMSTATSGKNVCRDAAKWTVNPPVKTLSGAERVRLTRREIGNGTFVQMYWNEDTSAKTLCLTTDAAYAYWMNAEDGSIVSAERDKDGCIRETLEPLSARFLYLCSAPLDGVSTKPLGTYTVLTTLPKWNLKAGNVNLTETALGDWRNLPELNNCAEDAIYTTTFSLPKTTAGKHYTLDLGEVCYVAEVHVNGKCAGKRIWRPYTFDITDYLQPGENTLEIIVKVSDYNAKVRQGQEGNPNYAPLANGGLMANGLLGPAKVLVF